MSKHNLRLNFRCAYIMLHWNWSNVYHHVRYLDRQESITVVKTTITEKFFCLINDALRIVRHNIHTVIQ